MDTLLARLGISLTIGLLVGLERGWKERNAPDQSRTAGIRTYGICGLLGGIFAALAQSLGAVSILITGTFIFAAIFTVFKLREAAHDDDFSVTGVMAGLAVFALGALSIVADPEAAAAAGTMVASLLASREVLHGLLRRISWTEVRSALILAIMTAVILPLLPNRAIDPWGGLNPRDIWFFTVLTAAISYFGYIAVRILGTTRGIIVSALSGALVSSTVVTLALGRSARAGANPYMTAGAASLAAMVSVMRVCLVIAIVETRFLATMALPALAAAFGFGLCGVLLLSLKHEENRVDSTPARSPFELGSLLAFALLFGFVSLVNTIFAAKIGARGLITVSAISGSIDVDVAVLSALRQAATLPAATVGLAILTAMATNALLRVALTLAFAPFRFWATLSIVTTIAASLAGLTMLLGAFP